MANIIDLFSPTMAMQQQKWKAKREEEERRLRMRMGLFKEFGPEEFGGPEFARSRELYGELGAMGMPEDIGGVGGLNAAERARLVEEQELIGGQLGTAQEEMRNLVGRMGGGGSEMIGAMENLRVGATGARAAALRGALGAGQQRVETRRGEALRGKEVAAGGFGGLAGQREAGEQWRKNERMQLLLGSMGDNLPVWGGGAASQSIFPQGGQWSKFGLPPSEAETRMRMRNEFVWPTQYGRKRSTTPTNPYLGRGAYSFA